jgi:hypothetical protein
LTRWFAVLAATLILGAGHAAAQDSLIGHPICMKAAAAPRCGSILLTNFGILALGSGAERGEAGFRLTADWGLLINTTHRSAFGASWLLSADRDGLLTGPMVRGRFWSHDSTSLEIGLGHGVSQANDNAIGMFGLIKWNSSPTLGLSLRPEWRRHTTYGCEAAPPFQCSATQHGVFALSAGIELGGVAGLVGSLSSAAAGFVVLIAYLSSDD